MNSKQLTVAWLMGIALCAVWALWWYDPLATTPRCLLVSHVITLIIGGLSLYTVRDRKR